LFPPDVRAASLPWFERGHALETALETAFRSRANAAAALPEAHRALTETDLRTLPLWSLGSNVDVQRPVRRAIAKGKNGPLAQFELGVAGLADRDWTAAERGFRASYTLKAQRPALHYWLYALCMDGRFEEAARLADRNGVRAGKGPGDAEVWSFLTGTFPEVAAGTEKGVRPLL
jgi:hypothetical protein